MTSDLLIDTYEKFDFICAMEIIVGVEKSQDKGDCSVLKKALKDKLGPDAFKKMASLGFIHGGFYILDGKIIDTYAVTQSYNEWSRILNRKAIVRKFISRIAY